MALGPGRYANWCAVVRDHTRAGAVALIVVDGTFGSGWSVNSPPELLFRLPELLESMAKDIRQDLIQQSNAAARLDVAAKRLDSE